MAAINRCHASLKDSTRDSPSARQLYGPGRSLPFVVSGLYDKLDELRRLYRSETIEAVLDDVIAWRERFNRLVELQSKVTVSVHELREFQVLKEHWKQYLADLARQKAQERNNSSKNRTAISSPRT
jgi:hypothetical protein